MRLINAERYAEKMRDHANVLRDGNPTSIVATMAAMSYDIAADEAMKEPTIDAAPVRHDEYKKCGGKERALVCCEHCKFMQYVDAPEEIYKCGLHGVECWLSFYCVDGERKDD